MKILAAIVGVILIAGAGAVMLKVAPSDTRVLENRISSLEKESANYQSMRDTLYSLAQGLNKLKNDFALGSGGEEFHPTDQQPVQIANGGTGATSFNQGGVVFSDGTTLVQNTNFVVDNDTPKLGFGTTAPFGLVSIEALLGQVGSGTPILFVGSSGTSSPLFQIKSDGSVNIATDTDNGAESRFGPGLVIGTSTYIGGGLSVLDGAASTGETPTTTAGDFLVAGFSKLLSGLGTQCQLLSSGFLDMSKGVCFEYATSTDGAIRVIPRTDGLSYPVRITIYHTETSGNSEVYFVNNLTQGTTTYTLDTGTATPYAVTAAGVDWCTLWYEGTTTSNNMLSVDCRGQNMLPQ